MKKLGFLQKQVLIYSLLILIFMAILILWTHSYIMNISLTQSATSQEQLANSSLSQVDGYLDQMLLIATEVAHDTEIERIMETLYKRDNSDAENHFSQSPEETANLQKLLDRHNEIKNPVCSIDIYNRRGDYVTTNPAYHFSLIHRDWYFDFLDLAFVRDAREFIMMGPTLGESDLPPADERFIYMIMPIKSRDGGEFYGYVEVFQQLGSLYAQLDFDQESTTDIYLFYEVDGQPAGQIYPDPAQHPFPDLQDGHYHKTQLQSSYGWFVILLQDQSEFLAPYRQMLVYLYLGSLALFLLLLACVYLLVQHTNKPILALSRRVREATLTNLPGGPVSGATDEVKELEQSVDSMMQRLKASVTLEQQAYLKALQAQMDPHFLYNCLSTISALGAEADVEVIPRFCLHLAAMLRYETTYQNDLVTLADELGNVRDYLTLMKIRYEDNISYEIDADDALLTLPLPRLVLQPLVENCFSHGFQGVKPPWHLTLRAFREDGQWVIAIADNGAGFDQDRLDRLRAQVERLMQDLKSGTANLQIGGLGLASTIVRLRLMSAQQTDFSITPNTPTGTVVTLRGEFHDERSGG